MKDFNIIKIDWKNISKDIEDLNNGINNFVWMSMYYKENVIFFEYIWNNFKNIFEVN